MSKNKAKKEQQLAEQLLRQAEQATIKSMDPTALKQEFYSYRKRVNELTEQLNSLNVSLAENNQKYLMETYEFQQRLKQEQQQRDEVRNKYEKMKIDNDIKWKEKEKLESIYRKNQESRRVETLNELSGKVSELRQKIDKIKLFKSKQDEYLQRISQLEAKIQRAGNSHKHQLGRLFDEHQKIRQINSQIKDNKIELIKDNQYKRARRMVDDRDKSIFVENDILKDQRMLYKQEQIALGFERDRLKQEISEQQKILKDLQTLNPSQENYERSVKIVNLQDRIAQLKKYRQEQIVRYSSILQNQQKKYSQRTQELQKQIKNIRNSSKLKDKQIKDLRMYAQMVLDQRKPLEWYTLEVLSENPKQNIDRMSGLDSILRQLFVKINSGIPPKNWRNYLKQNITIIESLQKDMTQQQMSMDWPSHINNQSIESEQK